MNNRSGKIVLLLLTICSCIALAAAQVRAVIEPSKLVEGEPFMLQLHYDGDEKVELQELPDNFKYLGSSQSTRIINGVRSGFVGYQFMAPAPGKYTIGQLKVKVGKETVETEPLTLEVVKDSAAALGIEDVFARGIFGGNRSKIYVGEEIPLTVKLFYPKQLDLRPAYPVLDIGKSVFRDYRSVNPENPSFARPSLSREVVDEKLYEVILFPTAFRPLAAGKLAVSGYVNCQILIPDARRRSDPFSDFWSGTTSYRKIDRQLKFSLPEITVSDLPPLPQDGVYLGVVGEYTLQAELQQKEVNALEPLSLNVVISGAGMFETVKAPEITLPDCRVYPGEINRKGNKCIISYAFIPLKAGKMPIKNKFYIFDPVREAYQSAVLDTVLEVRPAVGKTTAAAAPAAAVPEAGSKDENLQPEKEDMEKPVRSTLLYCKKSPEDAWSGFYRNYRIIVAVGFFIAGPLFYLLCTLLGYLRSKRVRQPETLRREKAGSMRNVLSEKLRRAPAEDLPELATGEIADFLSSRWKLAPGSTLEEIADKAYDKELAEVLHQCAQASYLPRELAKKSLPDAERIRAVLLAAIKCVVVFCSLLAISVSAADKVPAEAKTWHEALQAYDRGDYERAKGFFEKYRQENGDDPHVLYNLGCIAEAGGEQEMALWLLSSAALMSPGDSAARENCNVMRRKFFLPEKFKADSPSELIRALRDRFHAEDYLVLAGIFCFALFVLLSFRKHLAEGALWGAVALLLSGILISLALMASSYAETYRDGQALVVTKKAELYTFPGQHNGRSAGFIPGGTPLEIIEQQSDYSLVRSDSLEGWTSNQNIRRLLY